MAARRSRVRIPTHHSSQFSFACITVHFAHGGRPVVLFDDEVLVPKRGNLGKVSHDDNLTR